MNKRADIRARHEVTLVIDWGFDPEAQPLSLSNAHQCHADRGDLLDELDRADALAEAAKKLINCINPYGPSDVELVLELDTALKQWEGS